MNATDDVCTTLPASETIPPGMIRELVKAEMESRGWNLLKLSQESGVSYRAVHDWLSDKGAGIRGPSVENVERIMKVLGITASRRKSKPKGSK